MTEGAGANAYTYDPLNRLTQAAHPQPANPAESFTYDPVGNRLNSHLSTLHSYDAANRLLEDSNFTYTYDENGNLTSKTSKGNGEVTTYTYDAENQLIHVDRPGIVAEYRYDALGRRIEKNVNGVVTRYIYDNEDIAVEVDGTNTAQAFYLHGPGIDEPLSVGRFGAGGGTAVFHADGLGSITHLTSTTGAVARSYTYDSFGRIVAQTGTFTNPYTYTGRELDPESGLYYYRARYYDPTTGRFLQRDLFLELVTRALPNPSQVLSLNPQVLSGYSYVEGRPLTYLDPLGLWGVGVQGGAQAEAGIGTLGAGGQGAIGGGFFATGFFNRPSIGGFVEGGGYLGTPFAGLGWPGNRGSALGASYGYGLSAFLTNAVCAEQLRGTFTVASLNVGLGPFQISIQYATDGKTWMVSLSPPFAGTTYGISTSMYQTTTAASTLPSHVITEPGP